MHRSAGSRGRTASTWRGDRPRRARPSACPRHGGSSDNARRPAPGPGGAPTAEAAGEPPDPARLATCLLQLLARVAEDRARDDQVLDLAGALVDVRDADVAEPLLEQVLARDAERPEQLDAALRDLA